MRRVPGHMQHFPRAGVSSLIWLRFLTFPLILLTLGLFALVVNGLMLWLTSSLSASLGLGFHVSGFWAAFFGALVVSIVSTLLSITIRPPDSYRARS